MTQVDPSGRPQDLAQQRALWRKQASAIPGLLGGKAVWLPLVLELVKQVGEGHAVGLDTKPQLSFDIESVERRQGGAAPKLEPATWRDYYGFLRGLQLVENTADELRLTATGLQLQSDPTPARLAAVLADRIRLFAEVLSLIAVEPLTVDEVDQRIRARYKRQPRRRTSERSPGVDMSPAQQSGKTRFEAPVRHWAGAGFREPNRQTRKRVRSGSRK